MHEIVNPNVLARRDEYRQAFQSAKYFPHVQIENFFTSDACQRLVQDFPTYRKEDAVNELGEVGLKAWREKVRELGSTYEQVDDCIRSQSFLDLMSDLTGIPDLLYDPAYTGGGTHENLDGTELDIHVDFNYHPETGWHRRLNLIVFLNERWEEEWGGVFEVHRDPWDLDSEDSESFPPFLNRAVIFETSEKSWHGFNKIQLPPELKSLSRKSFAIYLYTKDRPEEEIAPAHATVYVPRPLPAHLVPGATLNERDYREVKTLLAKRDQQIHFLYEREKELSKALAGDVCAAKENLVEGPLDGEQAAALRRLVERREKQIEFFEYQAEEQEELLKGLLRRNQELEGKLHQIERPIVLGEADLLEPPTGLWEDFWAGADFQCRLRARSDLESVTLNGFIPDFFPESRQLRIQLGASSTEFEVTRGPIELRLDAALPAGQEATLRIQTSGTFQPSAAGMSADPRELAFQLSSIVANG